MLKYIFLYYKSSHLSGFHLSTALLDQLKCGGGRRETATWERSSTANHFWNLFQMLVCLVCWAALTRDQELQQNSFLEMGRILTVLRSDFSQQCTNQLKPTQYIQIGRASGNARHLSSILWLAETVNNNSKKDWKRLVVHTRKKHKIHTLRFKMFY